MIILKKIKCLTLSIISFIFIFSNFVSIAQEKLLNLNTNPAIKHNNIHSYFSKSKQIFDTLPFIDDFTNSHIYPDPSKWSDNFVFINDQYGKNPVTFGVATFDALDEYGIIYSNASLSQFAADMLTSVPLRLDSLIIKGQKPLPITKADKPVLTFFYQPGGYGNSPDIKDSLVLDFFSVSENKWFHAWSVEGTSFESFLKNIDTISSKLYKTGFKKITIPITDSAKYYYKGFKFRFRNFASIANTYLNSWSAGNIDIWNLDYIYLDINRSQKETNIPDIAFRKKTNSLLKNYHSMPYKQYLAAPSNETSDTLKFLYKNFSPDLLNVSHFYSISDISGNSPVFFQNPNPFSKNIYPLSDTANLTYFFPQALGYNFPDNKNKYASFEILAAINTTSTNDINRHNDTIRFIQQLNSFYAYDDGNPEAGYGLNGSAGMIALRFDLNTVPDTLYSLAIFFNSTYQNSNRLNFGIMIWDEKNGLPSNIRYNNNEFIVEETGFDNYKVYHLDTNIILTKKTFFIGIKQLTNENLNIGFDLNNNHKDKLFYNSNDTWQNSIYNGSLMIRPVFGKYLSENINEIDLTDNYLILSPNPVNSSILNLNISDIKNKNSYIIEIYSTLGKKIFSSSFNEFIDISNLQSGIYFLNLKSIKTTKSLTKKFIVVGR